MRLNLNPDSYLYFVPGDGGYTLRFGSDGGSEFNAAPVRVNVIASTYGEPVSIARAYEEVTAEGEEITATAHVKTEAGSVFLFVDRYCARPGGVLLSRSGVVEEGNEADKG